LITRLRIRGFKNLVDVEVRFGPFTCIAGANGVGKSNLLDAIRFLSDTADRSLLDAALRVRDDESPRGDVASIFHRYGERESEQMSFEVDMIIPENGVDDLGQSAKATSTYVTYKLSLRRRSLDAGAVGSMPIQLTSEELTYIRSGDAPKALGFRTSGAWRKSAVRSSRTTPFISTEKETGNVLIHQDGGAGRPRRLASSTLPRTVLSSANGSENPTATLARQELRSWKLLHLEPTALRKPDSFTAPTSISSDGAHLPATLYDLSTQADLSSSQRGNIYSTAANRLAELLDDVRQIRVDKDEKRNLFTLYVAGRDGSYHPARSLSDGTLRFLALAVIEMDSKSQGVICMEEPENGIHPARIPAILALLQDIAVDVNLAVDRDNPLRQVIINTHSPSVVSQVPESSLLFAEGVHVRVDNLVSYTKVEFRAMRGTWREKLGVSSLALGKLLAYLSPIDEPTVNKMTPPLSVETRRLIDNPTIQQSLFGETI
jgi:predicted ATPase